MSDGYHENERISSYRDFCMSGKSVRIFCLDWWLDAVAPKSWDVVLVEKNKRIAGAMPYALDKLFGQTIIKQPPLTQFLGPWLESCKGRKQKCLENEKNLLLKLIEKLPPVASFEQKWHWSMTNWLPFFWRGYSQTTRYTYRLHNLNDLDSIWSGFSSNIRSDIRKAENRFYVRLRENPTMDAFLDLVELTFARQKKSLPYPRSIAHRIEQACHSRSRSKIFIAEDEKGRPHAGCFLVWDEESAYYLIGGGDPELRNSGATSYTIWQAIKFSAGVSRSFDFEGSMIEPVEKFFRAFGTTQTPYFAVSKVNSRTIFAAKAIRNFAGVSRRL
jgi:hypothetical protein